jgi:CPA2 family monovalent cation:H+ antiporter-2
MEDLRLQEVVVFLVAAGVVIPLGKRLRLSPVLGFLLMGLLVGPNGIGRLVAETPWLELAVITDVEGVRALAELGIVFLLFMIGLGLSPERLMAMRRLVVGLGGLQIVITGSIIAAIAYGFGNSTAASVILGGCLALSSTAIVSQLLIEQGRFGTTVGRSTFAVLLAQDLAVVPILFMVEILSGSGQATPALGFLLSLGQAAVAVVLILVVGRLLLRPLFRLAASSGPEVFVASTLLVIISTAVVTHAAGLSAALGAFLIGLLLAETEYRHEVEANIEPFKGLLLGLFFMSIGMIIDPADVLHNSLWIFVSVAGLIALKTAVTGSLAGLFGLRRAQAIEVGLLLGQGGEFAFIVVALAVGHGLLPEPTGQFILIVVGCTMFLTPLLASVGRRIGAADSRRIAALPGTEPDIDQDIEGHVVIVGYGRTGHLLADLLDRQQVAHVALDLDASRVTQLRAQGAPVFLGDASRPAILQRANLDQALAMIVSMDDADAAERVLRTARQIAPDLPILARARDHSHAARLIGLGATTVVPEVLESGLHLGQLVLEQVGLPPDAARELIDEQRLKLEGY